MVAMKEKRRKAAAAAMTSSRQGIGEANVLDRVSSIASSSAATPRTPMTTPRTPSKDSVLRKLAHQDSDGELTLTGSASSTTSHAGTPKVRAAFCVLLPQN